MSNLRDIHDDAVQRLVPIYGMAEARAIVRQMLERYCSVSCLDIVLNPGKQIDISQNIEFSVPSREHLHAKNFNEAIEMLQSARPVQYVLGGAWFGDQEFYVSEGALIPRPETLELVRMVAQRYLDHSPSIADIGTGSGCIALTLKSVLTGASVEAFDISERAKSIFEINRERMGLDVSFGLLDILAEPLPHNFDIIVSNPPYVRESEKALMRANVLEYEPSEALFVSDEDPLLFYRRIGELGCRQLNDGGELFFEINEAFAEDICEMLKSMGYVSVCSFEDIFGKPRFINAQWRTK